MFWKVLYFTCKTRFLNMDIQSCLLCSLFRPKNPPCKIYKAIQSDWISQCFARACLFIFSMHQAVSWDYMEQSNRLFQPRLIGNTCLYIHFCNSVIMYLAARFAAVSKWNVQRVALKHTFNTWPWHVFIRLVHARIAVFSLCCLRYVLPPFIIQISGECR